ncbi:MAG: M13 family metallopeptidase [Acuticoccus sp.]
MKTLAACCLASLALATIVGPVRAQDGTALPAPDADDLVFSTRNMDPSTDPGADFYRYASGAWLDRVERPARLATYGIFDVMRERVKAQMAVAVPEAAAQAAAAPKGSATQLVGDFYDAYMDTAARDAAGIAPIRPLLDRAAAIASLDDLTHFMAHMAWTDGPLFFAGFGPSEDLADSSRYAVYAVGGEYGIDAHNADLLADPPGSPRLAAYRAFLEGVLAVAGYSTADATRIAGTAIEIERALHAAALTPVESVDPRNIYNPVDAATMQAQIPELDLALYFDELGLPMPERIVLTEPRLFPALSEILRERPLSDLKDHAALRVILSYMDVLTTRFEEPARALSQALSGVAVLPPREERALGLLTRKLGHPVSRVYVERFFPEETRQTALDMIERIKAAFRARIPTRDWLSEPTRAAALDKLDHFYYRVGSPDRWIDYTGVEIGADPVTNLVNLATFEHQRTLDRYGKPVERDQFDNPRATLPIIVNAAYTSTINGFEVPAAILQAPMFEAGADAPVYFCRLGAIIGHEMTHGFDSGGRLSDASGNLRDWWTPQDAAAFDAEAQKLIDQANAFLVLPDLHANGPLNIRENMADLGGITLAHDALMTYLAEHPEEDVTIDGLTPAQRCFIAWAQMWTWKATDPIIRAIVATDGHPPSHYRTSAPLQHLDAFYDAFGITEGDPMWLAPEKRANVW